MNILDEIIEKLKIVGYPFYHLGTEKIEDCIIYKLEQISSDKIKEQYKLSLNIIALSFEKGLKMQDKIKDIFLTFGDNVASVSIMEISLNGGGIMENLETDTYHFKLYFILKTRYKRGELYGEQ